MTPNGAMPGFDPAASASSPTGRGFRARTQGGRHELVPAGPAPEVHGYSVRAVADRLGIPTATLRSWNRRYDIGPGGHEPGKHRRYSESDIAALQRMLALVRAGVSPAGAAAVVAGRRRITAVRGDWQPLSTAAFALDTEAVSTLLTAHLLAYGVVDTWNLLCRPVFAAIVARQLAGEGCVDVEHLLSWSITAVLHSYVPPTAPTKAQAAVLACTGGETHVLPLETLRAALAERGVRAWMLGADVPTAALSDALARTECRPDVVLWSQHESTALTSAVRACAAAGARVFVGGPGWDSVVLPAEATPVTTLADAADRIAGPRDRP
ncbi:B12 binding domain-containing protein [Nocardia amikacinitolerans]|uniref:MerR family transcriptional regulator n=1 Tax=Nocardia amikacinitolerans TaxID=756689 RepID=UPI000B0593C9|nr:MerR family transcriptional regulator [Nocardia amikacinitolerans]MCP2318031.1 B12 binding domain-containing protein [Nocardia amikacinitolerans]